MNYGEVKQAIRDYSHRVDLDGQIPGFVQRGQEQIGRRFGVMPADLVNDADTNAVLDTHPMLYIYSALREMAVFTADLPSAQTYEGLYEKEVADMNINYHGLDWDNCPPPVMCPDKTAACCAGDTEECSE